MAIAIRRRSLIRISILVAGAVLLKLLFSSSSTGSSVSSLYASDPQEIQKQGVLGLVTRGETELDARKHKFLQVRMGRDDREDIFSSSVDDGALDYWERFQKPL